MTVRPTPGQDPSRMHAATPSPAAAFVTALGRVTLVLAGLGVAWALPQLLLGLLVPDARVAELAAAGIIPPLLARLLDWRHVLSLALLALSLLLLGVAWGLLRRHEWARRAFVVLLGVGAIANFAGLAAIDPFFDSLQALVPASMAHGPEGLAFAAQLASGRRLVWATSVAGALAIAGLHGWIAWQLCTAAVRAEFVRSTSGPPGRA